MLLLTTETLPPGCIVTKVFSMIQITHAIEVSQKGWWRSITEASRDQYQEAYDRLAAAAPREANAILGIRATTACQAFGNGMFLYLTYIGTPAVFEQQR